MKRQWRACLRGWRWIARPVMISRGSRTSAYALGPVLVWNRERPTEEDAARFLRMFGDEEGR